MKTIKYHNDINKLKLGNFTDNETDIFFGILLKTKETNENVLTLNFTELKSLIDVKHRNNDRFIQNVKNLNIKLKLLIQEVILPNGDSRLFSLFGDITTSEKRKEVEIEINKNFRYLIDNLMKNYTVIDLKQLVSLKGNYPKILYRLLKQFESKNTYLVKINDFRELMDIPNTYAMFTIRQKVLKPCMEQLAQYFDGLTLEEIKSGRNVSSLKFTWNKKKKEIIKANPSVKYKPSIGEREHQEYIKQIQKVEGIQDKKIEMVKETVSKDKFEQLVQELMDENNVKDPFSRKGFEVKLSLKYDVVEDIPVIQEKQKSLEKKVISIGEYKKILRANAIHNNSFNIEKFEKEFFSHTNVKGVSIMDDDGGLTSLDYQNILKW